MSLVHSAFSQTIWTEERVRQTMVRYRAEFLILYPRDDPWHNPVQTESTFLAALIQGTTPAWLRLVADNGEVQIFQAVSER